MVPCLIVTGSQKRHLTSEFYILEKASLVVMGAQPVTGEEEAVLKKLSNLDLVTQTLNMLLAQGYVGDNYDKR